MSEADAIITAGDMDEFDEAIRQRGGEFRCPHCGGGLVWDARRDTIQCVACTHWWERGTRRRGSTNG